MNILILMKSFAPTKAWLPVQAAGLAMVLSLLGAPHQCVGGGAVPSPDEQVEALDILHFAQYVEWPKEALNPTNQVIVIGVVGGGEFTATLKEAALGKTINDRQI